MGLHSPHGSASTSATMPGPSQGFLATEVAAMMPFGWAANFGHQFFMFWLNPLPPLSVGWNQSGQYRSSRAPRLIYSPSASEAPATRASGLAALE